MAMKTNRAHFKDAYLLTHAPHQVIEGALIAALANGINKIVFYINPDQSASLEKRANSRCTMAK